MKIFDKYSVRRITKANSLEEAYIDLTPWFDRHAQIPSYVWYQIVSYFLRIQGGAWAPDALKKLLTNIVFENYELEDRRAMLVLGFIESWNKFNAKKGSDRVNYIAWTLPYNVSKMVKLIQVRHVNFVNEYTDDIFNKFEESYLRETNQLVSIKKVKGNDETLIEST